MKRSLLAILLALCMGFALQPSRAQNLSGGSTTGPAVGGNVEPSTAVQKQNRHIPHAGKQKESGVSGTSAGAPAIEGRPDTQSGQAPKGREKTSRPSS